MTIRHFQIFQAVCDSGGVTAAAKHLNITQPTVSIAIKELESFYNTKLFDRINRKVYLTEAGILLRQYVDSVLGQYNEAAEVLRKGQTFSKCRLGINISFAETHLPLLTRALKKTLPNCELHITVQNNEHLETMLSSNQIDFAMYDGSNERISKHVDTLFREKMVLLVSPERYDKETISMEVLSDQPLLMREMGSGVRNCIDKAFQSHGFPQKVVMESISTMSLLSLAEQGLGFLFVPLSFAENEKRVRNIHVVQIEDEEIIRTYYLAHNERKHLTNTMAQIKEIIREIFIPS